METGKIVKWDAERGFGFVRPDHGGVDLFLHITRVEGDVREGDRVEFHAQTAGRGPVAVNARII